MREENPEWGTVQFACRLIGGDRPIHPSTYYRGVHAGIFPAPKRVSLGIARVHLPTLRSMLSALEAA